MCKKTRIEKIASKGIVAEKIDGVRLCLIYKAGILEARARVGEHDIETIERA